MPRYALTPDPSSLPAILPIGAATGSPGIGVTAWAATPVPPAESNRAEAAMEPSIARKQRIARCSIMFQPPC